MSHTIEPTDTAGAVAIVGMAGRFPGARDVAQFWANLAAGVDSITVLGDPGAHDPAARSWRVSAGGVIEDIDLFDADFFGVPPAEAAWMDPQHRLFLECVWLALEDAGCDPARLPGAVAVYAGTNINSYVLERLGHLAGKDAAQFMQILVGNEKDFLATRVSYKLNLRGESVTVQTSCSTSLVALHLACQSLLSGQSDQALAGGVSVRVPQIAEYTFEEGLIASPDGRCRPFDHRARGTVPGSGMGVVVLKRLEDALADRDHCYAVIRGSWINNDGRGKVGFTAPAVEGQAEVVSRALAMAGVSPDTIRFVETHGTGTPIGDPIEFEALRRAFRQDTRRRACALGALKANIGHLDTAAGIAGLMKTALALHHRLLPPSPHFERANPALDFENSPFYVNTQAEPWPANGVPRRGAVSSFGVGGTNVHVVLEEAPARVRSVAARPAQIVTLSARTAEALRAGASALAGFVEAHPEVELRDVAFTRNVGRQHFAHRRFVVAAEGADLAAALRQDAPAAEARGAAPEVVFMFPGQGAQQAGMARALYEHEPSFREAIEACLGHAERHGAVKLRGLMGLGGAVGPEAEEQLARPEHALPALLAVEYALAQVWKAWGVVPSAVIGHSYGELAAACVGGLFGLEEAVTLAIERGRLMQRMPPGRMLAVPLSEADAARWTGPQIAIAAVNADQRVVLSGPAAAMEALHGELRQAGIAGHWLNVPFAYHSALLDPVLDDYRALVARARPGALGLRCLSNLTADWLTAEQASDPGYWARQMRQPVRFAAGLRRLREAGHALFLEVGPGQTLSTLSRQVLGREATVCTSLPKQGEDWRSLLEAVGRLWSAGAPIAWRELERAQQGWSVPLPGYAFARQRHWIETAPPPSVTGAAGVALVAEEAPPPFAPAAAPLASVPEDGDAFRREVEQRLAEIWSEVLGRPEVSVHDNFFELGGDSLTATRILARLQATLPVSVTLEQVLVWPTIAELAEALQRGEPAAAAPAPAGGPAALSYAQEWLWTQQRLVPLSPAYHLPLAVRLRGPFDGATFRRTLADVVGRQESLRTVFVAEDGRPSAVVQPSTAVAVPLVDLSACRPHAQETLARRAAKAEIARLFDMAEAPPWRAVLVRLGEDDHVVLFVLHHIITDAWSMAVLVNEVTSAYVARRTGSAAPLPPLPVQYGQHAQQQRDRLEREGQDLAAYWKRQLADVPPLLTLSARPRPPAKSYHGGRHAFRVEPDCVERLAALARDQQATLFMVTMAAYQALLFRMTGQEDFCVGAPTAGRVRRETEAIIGCFIDTLPIRADLGGDPTFLELLGRVRRTTLDAFTHQALPFGRIVQEVRPARSPSYTPLFQVILDFNSTPPPSPPQFPGLVVEPFGALQPTAKTDLIVDLWRGTDGELRGAIEYDRALFGSVDIERFASAFLTLLQSVTATPEARVSALSIESEADRAQRAEAARERDTARRERLAAIKGGRQSHVTDSH